VLIRRGDHGQSRVGALGKSGYTQGNDFQLFISPSNRPKPMNSSQMLSSFPLISGLMGVIFLALGLRGILTKKPYIISSRWMFLIILISFSPSLLSMSTFFTAPSSLKGSLTFSLIPWMLLAMYAVMLTLFWLAMQGYTAFGITDSSFREGIIDTLDKMEIPFEETLGGIYLSSIGANLKVAIQSSMGTAQISIRPRKFNPTLNKIAKGLSNYYQTYPTSANFTICYFYTILGLLLVAINIMFAGWMQSL
jgi:hypothetical protein